MVTFKRLPFVGEERLSFEAFRRSAIALAKEEAKSDARPSFGRPRPAPTESPLMVAYFFHLF
jgi:hypothetical protein